MGIKIILVDNHKIVREGLRALLEMQPDMEVIAEAEDGLAAVRLSKELSPDVVVMHVGMPNLNGIEATRQITSQYPNVKVLALTMHTEKRFVKGMLKAGASGYVLKACGAGELAKAIRAVARRESFLSPRIAHLIVEDYVRQFGELHSGPVSILSAREREVLQFLAEGKSSKQTAAILGLRSGTVESHRYHLMKKLNIRRVAELVKYAIREGLVTVEKGSAM